MQPSLLVAAGCLSRGAALACLPQLPKALRFGVRIRLETARGVLIRDLDVTAGKSSEPAGVVSWCGRIFRFERTDGIWDRLRHVYRETTMVDWSANIEAAEPIPALEPDPVNAVESSHTKLVTLKLTARETALLTEARTRGSHASNKAVLMAGLAALTQVDDWSDEALIGLLSKRLRARRPRAPRQSQTA